MEGIAASILFHNNFSTIASAVVVFCFWQFQKKNSHDKAIGTNDTVMVCEFQTENDFQNRYGVGNWSIYAKLLAFLFPTVPATAVDSVPSPPILNHNLTHPKLILQNACKTLF